MLKARVTALCLIVSLSCVPLLAQTAADKDLLDRIRKEEKDNSQIMRTVKGVALEAPSCRGRKSPTC